MKLLGFEVEVIMRKTQHETSLALEHIQYRHRDTINIRRELNWLFNMWASGSEHTWTHRLCCWLEAHLIVTFLTYLMSGERKLTVTRSLYLTHSITSHTLTHTHAKERKFTNELALISHLFLLDCSEIKVSFFSDVYCKDDHSKLTVSKSATLLSNN